MVMEWILVIGIFFYLIIPIALLAIHRIGNSEPWRRGKGDIPRFEWWSSHDLRLMYETDHKEIILKMLKEGKLSESLALSRRKSSRTNKV